MDLIYSIPAGVEAIQEGGRLLLSTPEGGRVAVDEIVRDLWAYANGRSLQQVLTGFKAFESSPDVVRSALSCLVESGLLDRQCGEPRPVSMHRPAAANSPAGSQSQSETLVSVVIVSYKSREWLTECLPSLYEQVYRPLEIIVVDNGQLDDTAEWLAKHFPSEENFSLRLVSLEESVPFARAINLGAEAAAGDYLLLLNPDVRVDREAVIEAVEKAGQGIVALKLRFWWAPSFLNGIGNRVGAFSWGTDNALGHLDLGQFDHFREVPSACFAAVLISKKIWKKVGPADERFPMYYEDSEWSYRARLLGYSINLAPQAIVFHAFGGKIPGGAQDGLTPTKLRHIVYGRLRFALKIVGKYLWIFLRNYLLEDFANSARLLLRWDIPGVKAYLNAWRDLLHDIPEIRAARREIQVQRLVSDEDMFNLQRSMPATFMWHGLPELTWDLIQENYTPLILHGKTEKMPEFNHLNIQKRLLIVSNDVVDAKMAGPGMRYLEMARALSADLDVTLAVPGEIDAGFENSIKSPSLHIARYDERRAESLQEIVEKSDVALISGYMVEKFPFLDTTNTRLVVDLYTPFVLENLHYYLHESLDNQMALNRHAVAITNHLARIGDFFICGNDRQRDYWLGVLTANGRTNPKNFIADPSLNSLIDIVSIGFPDRPPRAGVGLIGVHPAIPPGSRVVLWGGGVWNWLDPLTLIKAWPGVLSRYPEARLVFLGTKHPNPLVPQHSMAHKAMELAQEIGEKDKTIIFIEWVTYEERETLLSEAAVGITLHPIHVETRFSLRTRVLDCFWADLPVVITEGDITSEWIREYDLGEVVPPHDPEAVTQALLRVLTRSKDDWKPAFEPLKTRMTWQALVEPLRRYCLEGTTAPDRRDRIPIETGGKAAPGHWALGRILFLFRTGGIQAVMHRGWRFIQWKLGNIK